MNLREAVAEVIESAMIDGWHSMEPETSLWKHNVQQQARAAITAMREALLSEPVVEAAASALLAATQRRIGFDPKECKALDELVPVVRQDYLIDARAALTAACSVAKQTVTANGTKSASVRS